MRKPGPEYLDQNLEAEFDREKAKKIEDDLKNLPTGLETSHPVAESGEFTIGPVKYQLGLESVKPEDYLLDKSLKELGEIDRQIDADPNSVDQRTQNNMVVRGIVGDTDPSLVKHLVNLTLEVGQTSFDLSKIVPEGYEIVYVPSAREPHAAVCPPIKTLVIEGNIASFATIASLLHELGHQARMQSMTDEEKNDYLDTNERVDNAFLFGDKVGKEEIATVLLNEREAWAYAVKKIGHFLKAYDEATQEHSYQLFLDYIHQRVLGENSSVYKMIQNPEYRGFVSELGDFLKEEAKRRGIDIPEEDPLNKRPEQS